MLRLRPAADRGVTRIDWLDSRHTFSFGEYHDPAWRGFRALRVLNDDRVRAASGFGSHPHRDMEIVSIVLDGALQHGDSLGNGSVIRPGEIQRMTAGTGIVHSEWNPSETDDVRFLQIWLLPRSRGAAPGYDQRPLPDARNAFAQIVAGRDGGAPPAGPGPVSVDSDADAWLAALDAGCSAALTPRRGHAWVHVATGDVTLDVVRGAERASATLASGDAAALTAAAVTGAAELRVTARTPARVLVFDLG